MNKSMAYLAAAAIFSLGSSLAIVQGTTIEVSPEAGKAFHEHLTTSNVTPTTVDLYLEDDTAVQADVTLNPGPAEIPEGALKLEGNESLDLNTRAIMNIIER